MLSIVMRIEGPTNPFHISRAYGIQPPNRVERPQAASSTERADAAQRLVAASVPGRVDFSGGGTQPPDSAAIPMYRLPADRNAAATAVTAGRMIDVQG